MKSFIDFALDEDKLKAYVDTGNPKAKKKPVSPLKQKKTVDRGMKKKHMLFTDFIQPNPNSVMHNTIVN
jgi:hypothetical protein